MADFNIRSESVDVEQIMKQIRSRIREKRGVDYTEEQVRELATVRLEKFLDPKNLRSDLLDQFRRSRPAVPSEPPPVEAPYAFSDETLFETHRGSLRFLRRLLKPILKLFFNPNPLINVLHAQAQFNVDLLKREQRRKIEFDRSRAEWNALYYEVLHNLVLEATRMSIEVKNLKMRVESLTSRLDFSERRVRALEGVVQYRPEAIRARPSAPRPFDTAQGRPESTDGREPQGRPEHGRGMPGSGRPDRVEGREPMRDEPPTSVPRQAQDDSEAGRRVEAGAPPEAREGGALPPGTGEAGRRRRRRRRGRRGAGMQPGGPPPSAVEQAGGGEPQGQDQPSFLGEADEDNGFEEAAEAPPAEALAGPEEEPADAGFSSDSGPVPSPDPDPSTGSGSSRDSSRDDDEQ